MKSLIMEANPAIKNAANYATRSIYPKVSHTQMGPSISWDLTTVPTVMSCISSNAKGVAKGSYVGETGQKLQG